MGKCLFLRKGETHTAPISGILANTLAVGSTVKLMENGVAAEYLVVHQGLPSSMYDASCDGTWLLRKDCYEKRVFDSSNYNNYGNSSTHSYLNDTFFNLFSETEQSAIMQVKIPYTPYAGDQSVLSNGNGLSTKVFLLSGYEVGFTTSVNSYFPVEGAKLDFFESGNGTSANNKRISYFNSSVTQSWTRSQRYSVQNSAWAIKTNGDCDYVSCKYANYGIRPALIVPSTALFDKTTLILKGVA